MSFPVYGTDALIDRAEAIVNTIYEDTGEEIVNLHLFKNDVEPDPNQTPETFVEADFTGYVLKAVTMGAASLNEQGVVVVKSNLMDFPTAAGVDVQTVYGVYLMNLAGTKVIAAQRFEVPQIVGGPYPQAITGVWRFSEPLTNYGWVDVEA